MWQPIRQIVAQPLLLQKKGGGRRLRVYFSRVFRTVDGSINPWVFEKRTHVEVPDYAENRYREYNVFCVQVVQRRVRQRLVKVQVDESLCPAHAEWCCINRMELRVRPAFWVCWLLKGHKVKPYGSLLSGSVRSYSMNAVMNCPGSFAVKARLLRVYS